MQSLIVILIVAVAVGSLVWRAVRKKSGSCGGCDHCSGDHKPE